MRFEENLDSHILGESQRFVQFFPHQTDAVGIVGDIGVRETPPGDLLELELQQPIRYG